MSTVIAFLGLGHMGGPMAANLAAAGHDVRGFDLVPASLDQAREKGITVAESAADAVAGASVVVTMLPSGKHVLDCYADVVPAAGAEANPLLEIMGRKIVHCGQSGNGQAAKLCNNMILGVSMIAVSEAFVLGEKLGLTNQALFDVASTASGQCWALTTNCPVPGPVPTSPANNDYTPGFAAALMRKDLGLVSEAVRANGVEAQLGMLASAMYEAYAAEHGDRDFSGIVQDIRERSGGTA